MYIIIKMEWSNRVIREHNLERRDALRPKFCDVVLMQVGAICQQGAESEPTSSGGRIATIFIFIAFMFIYTSYSANIVALLQSTTDSIRTVEDLTNSFIKLGVDDKPYSRYYFQVTALKYVHFFSLYKLRIILDRERTKEEIIIREEDRTERTIE